MKMRYTFQPLKQFATSSFEGKLWKVVVGVISGLFAYKGYQANVAIILFPMAGVCLVCIVGLLTSMYFSVLELFNKK
ncbi:hypothetical protein J7384_16840 [Endozoicomonas sp. G2_1]|uniref:hypothetical protein n=1 Tax=Endozoicomonas sp. G2_1 TaxID=2821091 RepID=UPI001ADC5E31|nr:hypothetical protein [Endozoicomonas sp. G2_1]MBO9492030.1 hypothetical protein [Endozoicomonas sp. G2_1]